MPASVGFVTDVTTALGGNLIDVELTQEDFDYALDKAIRVWKQKGNNNLNKKFLQLPIITDTQTYDLGALLPTEDIQDIVRIIKPRSEGNSADPFYTSFIQHMFDYRSQLGDAMAEYELAKQNIKTYERYTNHNTQFIWNHRTDILTLLDNPKVDNTWVLEAYCNLTEAEYEEHLWVREYAIAEAKIILGRAYRKFQALSTPTGETSLDGNELVQEGKDEQTTLLENINEYVDGDPTGAIILMG
jgi:hypothetical protein